MSKSITDHLGLDKIKFEGTGAFDALVDWDTKLFVDPFLLRESSTPEFQGAHDEILKYFSDTLLLIGAVKQIDDLKWTTARNRLVFKEIGAFGLGYSSKGISGSGIGKTFANQLIRTLKEIYDAGVTEPELFELLGLFQEGVGADRISDMTCRILVKRFASFSERVLAESGFKGKKTKWRFGEYTLPSHPEKSNFPILVSPKEFLRDLPVAHDFSDIDWVCAENDELRTKLNNVLGSNWRKDIRELGKGQLKSFFIKNPEILEDIISTFKAQPVKRYDFEKDPSGEYIWRQKAQQFAADFPLALILPDNPQHKDVCQVVEQICDKFKENIEQNGLWEALYNDSKKPRKERIAQRLFYAAADSYCDANNVDLSRESDAGRGPVDFKLSRGSKDKVVVEAKLSTNKDLLNGFQNQVEIYKKAEKAHKAYYLVIQVSDSDKSLQNLFNLKNKLTGDGLKTPEIVTVDGTPKKSASKVKTKR